MKRLFSTPWTYQVAVLLVVVGLSVATWLLIRNVDIPVLMPSGEIANQQRDLIIFTVSLAGLVVVPVFVLLAFFAHRYREGAKAVYRPEWADNKWLEIIWWGIPIVIIIVLSVVTYLTSHSLDPYKTIKSDTPSLKVQVVALQWKWLFIYPEHGVASVNDLVIPVDRPVHFSLSADAPMSAFWVPALGSQIYSMNAMNSQLNLIANKEGLYKGYNTNINGQGYADMVFDVNVVDETEFDDWTNLHSESGHVLDKRHLEELSEPSLVSAPMYMKLADDNLYNSVIMKYMKHHSVDQEPASDEVGAPELIDEAIDHEGKTH